MENREDLNFEEHWPGDIPDKDDEFFKIEDGGNSPMKRDDLEDEFSIIALE